MKQLKIAVLALLLIAFNNNVNAQNDENPWMATFSANFIDISTPTDETEGYFGSYKFDGNDVNSLPWLSKLAVARYLGAGFSAELSGTYNKVDSPWGLADDVSFFAIDLSAKYNLSNAFGDTGWFDPFLYVGAGQNWVGTEDGISFNVGGGFNVWITNHLGVNFTTGYKKVNTSTDFDMYQHSLGLAWRFGSGDGDDDAAAMEVVDTDTDGDGITDCCDECPEKPGLDKFQGCPDTDGDGIPDNLDRCPETPGPDYLEGCPDRDGDGTPDIDDACPDTPGPRSNAGCPLKDTDGDGVLDIVDHCVDVPGPASNNGCPDTFADQEEIDAAFRDVNFDFNKYTLRPEVPAILDNVASILNKNQNLEYRFSIDGHTDSIGSDAYNLTLSKKRAETVRDYLVSKGVDANRLKAQGFGESYPVDTNETDEGRFNNRRVEINQIED